MWNRENVQANPTLTDNQGFMEKAPSSTRLPNTTRPSTYRCRRHFPESGKSEARSLSIITPSGQCPVSTLQNHVSSANVLTQQNVKNDREHPPTSSTQSDDAKSRANNTSHNAINHPSASAAQSKRKAGSIGNASQTATNRTPAPSAQSKVGGSSVKDTSSPVTMVEDGSRKVTKVHDLLN